MENYYEESASSGLQADGIQFFIQEVPAQCTDIPVVRAHIHSSIEILFIRSGSFLIYADDVPREVHPGDTVLFRSKTIHRIFSRQEAPCSYYVLKIDPMLLCSLSFRDQGYRYLIPFTIGGRDCKTVWDREESARCGIHQALSSLIQAQTERFFGYDLCMKIQTGAILLALLRSLHTDPLQESTQDSENIIRRIYSAMLYINTHYSESVTAEDCCSQAYMSYSYFSRCFRRVAGKSFKEYLNLVRINHAEQALLSGESSITEIASACGFNSVSYFISTYKKLKGITPMEFRKTCQLS